MMKKLSTKVFIITLTSLLLFSGIDTTHNPYYGSVMPLDNSTEQTQTNS